MNARQVSRRSFLGQTALAAAAAALVQAPEFLADGAWFETARAADADLLHDTYNGLLAFVVPGRDEYSIQQGRGHRRSGGRGGRGRGRPDRDDRRVHTTHAEFDYLERIRG